VVPKNIHEDADVDADADVTIVTLENNTAEWLSIYPKSRIPVLAV
jgi:hypothetical protein